MAIRKKQTEQPKTATFGKGSVLANEAAPKTRVSGKNPSPASSRFARLYRVVGECWEWAGSKDRKGYGRMWVRGRGNTPAHRASFEMHVRPLADGECVLHRCDNPPCVNPAHLFAGSLQLNNKDMHQKRRHAFGERSGQARITSAAAAAIRAEYVPHSVTYRALSAKYGISKESVRDIVKGYTWQL